jgi:hypothetical protein
VQGQRPPEDDTSRCRHSCVADQRQHHKDRFYRLKGPLRHAASCPRHRYTDPRRRLSPQVSLSQLANPSGERTKSCCLSSSLMISATSTKSASRELSGLKLKTTGARWPGRHEGPAIQRRSRRNTPFHRHVPPAFRPQRLSRAVRASPGSAASRYQNSAAARCRGNAAPVVVDRRKDEPGAAVAGGGAHPTALGRGRDIRGRAPHVDRGAQANRHPGWKSQVNPSGRSPAASSARQKGPPEPKNISRAVGAGMAIRLLGPIRRSPWAAKPVNSRPGRSHPEMAPADAALAKSPIAGPRGPCRGCRPRSGARREKTLRALGLLVSQIAHPTFDGSAVSPRRQQSGPVAIAPRPRAGAQQAARCSRAA